MLAPKSRKLKLRWPHFVPGKPHLEAILPSSFDPPAAPAAQTDDTLPPPPEESSTRQCTQCWDSLPYTGLESEFPSDTDKLSCHHQHEICRSCLVEHVALEWRCKGILKILCPKCSASIKLRTLERFAGHEIRKREVDGFAALTLLHADSLIVIGRPVAISHGRGVSIFAGVSARSLAAGPGTSTPTPPIPSSHAPPAVSKPASPTASPGTKNTPVPNSTTRPPSTLSAPKHIFALRWGSVPAVKCGSRRTADAII